MAPIDKTINECLLTSLNNEIFSGVAVGVSTLAKSGKNKRFLKYAGFTESVNLKNPISQDILFDLSSLTKPLATVLCTLNLINEGVVDWQEKLDSLLCTKVDQTKKEITLYHLLSHCSGLPAHKPYYERIQHGDYRLAQQQIINSILNERLESSPGEKRIYSDLGYILLGHIIEKKTGESFDEFWKRKIVAPFHLNKKLMFLKNCDLGPEQCVATSVDPVSSKPVCGRVNDDNCRIMGGVAGHAGLFGTLDGVVSICEEIVKEYKNLSSCSAYSNSILRKALTRESRSTWLCGFDTPAVLNSSAGQYFSKKSVGHLGYTGASFWMDMGKGIIVVVLTNRVYMKTSKERMNSFRKTIHNIIMKGVSDYK